MKKLSLILAQFILIFIITINALAQDTKAVEKIQKMRDEKKELTSLSSLYETVLDSIIYYTYDTESDSVRLLKKTYESDEPGVFETRYEYVWVDDQWVFSVKHELTFNELDQLVMSEYFNWDMDLSEWVNNKKITITYDENGYDDLYVYLRWNADINSWDNYYKDDSDYDPNGNRVLYIEWLGNEMNEWEYFYKEVNTFNTDNSLNDSYIAFWNADINEWENYHKEEFYYHESGLTSYRLYYLWMTGDWRLSLKTDYTYTETELYESLTTYQNVEDEWVLFSQRNYTYDENENELLIMDLSWVDEMWVNYQKYDFDYDQNNFRTLYLVSVWDIGSNSWMYQYKNEDAYGDLGNWLMSSAYNWSVEEMKWIGYRYNEYFYDDDFKRAMDIFYNWDEENEDWFVNEKGFYYRSIVLQTPEVIANSIHVYPNPVESVLIIKTHKGHYTECSIISITGQQIEHFKLNDKETMISMDNYPSGIYFLQIQGENETVSKKIIKQ